MSFPFAALGFAGGDGAEEDRNAVVAYGAPGPLLIHASKGKKGKILVTEPPFSRYISSFDDLPFGAIIGQVTLADVVSVEQLQLSDVVINHLTLEERAFGDYTKGRFAWVLEEPIQFTKPIPLKGTLGLWEYNGPL